MGHPHSNVHLVHDLGYICHHGHSEQINEISSIISEHVTNSVPAIHCITLTFLQEKYINLFIYVTLHQNMLK